MTDPHRDQLHRLRAPRPRPQRLDRAAPAHHPARGARPDPRIPRARAALPRVLPRVDGAVLHQRTAPVPRHPGEEPGGPRSPTRWAPGTPVATCLRRCPRAAGSPRTARCAGPADAGDVVGAGVEFGQSALRGRKVRGCYRYGAPRVREKSGGFEHASSVRGAASLVQDDVDGSRRK